MEADSVDAEIGWLASLALRRPMTAIKDACPFFLVPFFSTLLRARKDRLLILTHKFLFQIDFRLTSIYEKHSALK
jgi:hypothetical protein